MTFGRLLVEAANPTLQVQDCKDNCPLDLLIEHPQ